MPQPAMPAGASGEAGHAGLLDVDALGWDELIYGSDKNVDGAAAYSPSKGSNTSLDELLSCVGNFGMIRCSKKNGCRQISPHPLPKSFV